MVGSKRLSNGEVLTAYFEVVKELDEGKQPCHDWNGFAEIAFKKVPRWFYAYFMVGDIIVVESDEANKIK